MSDSPLNTFPSLEIQDNAGGWGPSQVPEKFKDLPYQPFNKAERLGRSADWISSVRSLERRQRDGVFLGTEDDFRMVDSRVTQKKRTQPRFVPMRSNMQRDDNRGRQGPDASKAKVSRQQKFTQGRQDSVRQYKQQQERPPILREPSVAIQDTWSKVASISLEAAAAEKVSAVPTVKDFFTAGWMDTYDKSYDRVTVKNTRNLETRTDYLHFRAPFTLTDKNLMEIAKGMKCTCKTPDACTCKFLFGIDAVLALVMASPKALLPWDVEVEINGKYAFFDRRERWTGDMITVNENILDQMPEDAPTPQQMSLEATQINQRFAQQVLFKDRRVPAERPHPFMTPNTDPNTVASVVYRYREFTFSDNKKVVVRAEVDGVSAPPAAGATPQFVMARALNEVDRTSDWKTKFAGAQQGAVMATEMKTNAAKLSRWAAHALLAGVDQVKLGFVTRTHLGVRGHQVLSVSTLKPSELLGQLQVTEKAAWGTLKHFVDKVSALPDGKYILVKDPYSTNVDVFNIPEDDEEEEEEE